ncbi:MAG: DUF1579 family protein [Phycisphaeraceae bacterium]|nr:DUF1579 family protein [Phycisphaeraceae bacterium]
MNRSIPVIALCLSSAMFSCASRTMQQVAAPVQQEAFHPVSDQLGFALGDWAIHNYSGGGLGEAPVGLVSYRSLFDGMVLEESRSYEWARPVSDRGEIEIRWYQYRKDHDDWRYLSVSPHAILRLGAARNTPEGFRIIGELPGPGASGAAEPVLDEFLLKPATEKNAFEVYGEDDADRPLVWWLKRSGFSGSLRPVEYLVRTDCTMLEPNAVSVRPVRAPEWAQFDFWLGEWDLAWQGGAGTNTIDTAIGGWAVRENFASEKTNFSGGSLSVYDRANRVWRQVWMDSQGAYLSFVGSWDGDQMVLTLDNPQDTAKPDRDSRMRWHDIEDDRFTWTYEGSDDDGATWSTLWEIEYTRRD